MIEPTDESKSKTATEMTESRDLAPEERALIERMKQRATKRKLDMPALLVIY